MLGRIRERFAAARAGDLLELEQVQIRLAIYAVVYLYLLVAFFWDGVLDGGEPIAIVLMTCGVILGVTHLGWVLMRPGVNHRRRYAAVLLDMGCVSVIMTFGGEIGVMVYWVYPWVAIGNGFRFGRWYLHYAQALALAGFTVVLLLSQYWHQHLTLAASLYLTLILIPLYVSSLLEKLRAANQRLQEARAESEIARAEAEAATVAKTKFLAAASHDLRQPMQALSMYASVLEEEVSGVNALRVVHGIQLSVTTLEQLFDGVLDISKIESGVIKPNAVAFPLMPLIEHVVELERPIASQKNLDLRVVRTSVSVRSDPALLERMLKNLVTNAIRYTQRGRILVGCRRVGCGRLRLEVVDSGIGIPRQEQERIFDEYYQLAGASAQGLGLGLPIVKSLADLLGHTVAVKSETGRGSVFSIELDRAPEAATPVATSDFPHGAVSGANVVLVDDDAEIRDSMRLLLESWGCRYVGGATVAEVEHGLRTQGVIPDALIVDYRLADAMTGLEAIDRLRAAFGGHLPALLITGTPNASQLRQHLAGVLLAVKPVPPGKLRAFLSHVLRNAQKVSPM